MSPERRLKFRIAKELGCIAFCTLGSTASWVNFLSFYPEVSNLIKFLPSYSTENPNQIAFTLASSVLAPTLTMGLMSHLGVLRKVLSTYNRYHISRKLNEGSLISRHL